MAKKETNFYFDTFAKGMAYANDAAVLLKESFDNFDAASIKTRLDQMHNIEHTADGIKHNMMEQLVKEFLPPIEREDIVELAHTIDEVTDAIEDVLLGVYMYNITELRPEMKEFTRLIERGSAALKEMVADLHNFRKSTVIREKIIEVNGFEEEGDKLYTDAVRTLYTEEKDPVAIIAWTTLYNRLEKCLDSCEHVADRVEQVILKNS